jgi:hypothetical protein
MLGGCEGQVNENGGVGAVAQVLLAQISISLTNPEKWRTEGAKLCYCLVTSVTVGALDSGLYSEHGELRKTPPSSLLVATNSSRCLHHRHVGTCGASASVLRNTDDVRQPSRFTGFVRCVCVIFSPRCARLDVDGRRRHSLVVLAKPSGRVFTFQIRK